MLTLTREKVRYFINRLLVTEGSFLAKEDVGTPRTEREFDTS